MTPVLSNIRIIFISILVAFIFSCSPSTKKDESAKQPSEIKSELSSLNDQIAANPQNAELYFKRAKVYLGKKIIKQSYEDLAKAVTLDSTKSDYYLLLADVSFQGLQIQKAIDAFKKAIVLDPKNTEGHLKLSELYLYIKAYSPCLEEANEALKIDKNIAKAYFIKGFAYKETGDTAKALSSFQTAVEIQPEYYDAYIQLGNIETARMHPVALQYYNNALRVQPNSTEALYNRGLMLQNMGELDKAAEDYNQIIKIDSKYSDAYYNLGYIDLAYKKEYKSAIVHFTDAIRVNQMYAEAFYNRGLCYEFLGDKKSAEVDFRKALEIIPTFKLAKEKLKRK